MGMGGQRHAPAALPPGKTRYQLNIRLLYSSVNLKTIIIIIIKVKFTLEQSTKAQRGSRGIALLFL
jgi:hypothetical protein